MKKHMMILLALGLAAAPLGEAAWEDGRVSDDEENMLQSMRDSLSISDQEHKTILGVVRAKLN